MSGMSGMSGFSGFSGFSGMEVGGLVGWKRTKSREAGM